jgi:hypothetical protein
MRSIKSQLGSRFRRSDEQRGSTSPSPYISYTQRDAPITPAIIERTGGHSAEEAVAGHLLEPARAGEEVGDPSDLDAIPLMD